MVVKYICDLCSKEEGVGRVIISMAVSQPHSTAGLPKFDSELCSDCLNKLTAAIEAALPAEHQNKK